VSLDTHTDSISPAECDRLRERAAAGALAGALADETAWTTRVINKHLKGRCGHDRDDAGGEPVECPVCGQHTTTNLGQHLRQGCAGTGKGGEPR